ncbi:MAG: LLM class flavin-dependent oxidoreductase [Anaerolineales bacterium]
MMKNDKASLTFGIMLAPVFPWKQIVQQARLVESLGFDKLWVPDHFVNPEDVEMDWFEILDHMLSEEVTTYPGKYFDIQNALMRPKFISQPRPKLNVAARGPKALRLAAKYGDAWNGFYPGQDLTPKQSSDVIHQHCEMVSEFALEAGRDPAQIGRSFCFGWTSDILFRSLDAFYETIGRYTEAGIQDFCFIYALGLESWKDQTIITEDLLQQIALEAIPRIRSEV